MALGWDQAFAQACVDLEIPFVAAVPFHGQEKRWPRESQKYYNDLLVQSKRIHYITEFDDKGEVPFWKVAKALQDRNAWMVMIEDLEGGIATKVIGRCFKPGATVILFSCSTGAPAEVKKVQTVNAEENERAWGEQTKANGRLINEGKSPRPPRFRYSTKEVLVPNIAERMAMAAPIEFTVIAPEETASVGPVDVEHNGSNLEFAVTYESPRANKVKNANGFEFGGIIYDKIKAATYRSQ
jgi:hypothetical protein